VIAAVGQSQGSQDHKAATDMTGITKKLKELKANWQAVERVIEALRGLETARRVNCAPLKSQDRGERRIPRNPENAEARSRVTRELRTALIETIEGLQRELKQLDRCIAALQPLKHLNHLSSKERQTKLVRQERSPSIATRMPSRGTRSMPGLLKTLEGARLWSKSLQNGL
jgi:hypothetical protein